jgi:hypothetical protein
MAFYPMKCTFSSCGMKFEYATKPDLYMKSKEDSFRDVRCTYCGSFGTMVRCYPSDSAPANLTVKGTWGRHASPGLKGREFYTKQERDRQLTEVGRVQGDTDYSGAPKISNQKQVYKKNEETGMIEEVKAKEASDMPVVWRVGDETPPPPKAPANIAKEVEEIRSERAAEKIADAQDLEVAMAKKSNAVAVALYLKSNGPSRLKDISSSTGIAPSAINRIASLNNNDIERVGRGVYSIASSQA